MGTVEEFYRGLYEPDQVVGEAQSSLLSSLPPSPFTAPGFHSLPSLSEVITVIRRLPRWKAPGPDGLPGEFYQSFSKEVAPILVSLLSTPEHLPFTWGQSSICLIYKKGEREDLGNWRPISLINSDAKIASKILANRLS
ncbi:hypothetical protein BJ684DRAFT_7944, partial [Piptocephalis cylindrospora]